MLHSPNSTLFEHISQVKLQVENQQQKHHPLSSLVHSPRILTPSMNHQSSPET
ncbi:unnamed protein product, partial [Rotaria magnacalcarata]